jgi:hypothetical protein
LVAEKLNLVYIESFMQNPLEGSVVSIFMKDFCSQIPTVEGVYKPPASSARVGLGMVVSKAERTNRNG